MKTWWISFVDPRRELGSQFVGVMIVAGETFEDAHETTKADGSPDCQCSYREVPQELADMIPASYMRRLLTRAECEELDAMTGQGSQN